MQLRAVSLIKSARQKLSLVVHFSRCRFLSRPFQAGTAARCCPSLSWWAHPKLYQDSWQPWSKQGVGHCPACTELNIPGIRQDSTKSELETMPKAVRSKNFHVLAFMSVSYMSKHIQELRKQNLPQALMILLLLLLFLQEQFLTTAKHNLSAFLVPGESLEQQIHLHSNPISVHRNQTCDCKSVCLWLHWLPSSYH